MACVIVILLPFNAIAISRKTGNYNWRKTKVILQLALHCVSLLDWPPYKSLGNTVFMSFRIIFGIRSRFNMSGELT